MYIEGEASQSASRGSRIVGETGHGAKSSCRPAAVELVSESEKRKVVRAAAGRIREAEDVREQFRKSDTTRDWTWNGVTNRLPSSPLSSSAPSFIPPYFKLRPFVSFSFFLLRSFVH